MEAKKNKQFIEQGLDGELVKDLVKFNFMEQVEVAFNVSFFSATSNSGEANKWENPMVSGVMGLGPFTSRRDYQSLNFLKQLKKHKKID